MNKLFASLKEKLQIWLLKRQIRKEFERQLKNVEGSLKAGMPIEAGVRAEPTDDPITIGMTPGKVMASIAQDSAGYAEKVKSSAAAYPDLQNELARTALQFIDTMKKARGNDIDDVATLWFSLITEINVTLWSCFRSQTDEEIREKLDVIEASLISLMSKTKGTIPYRGPGGQA